ncbi:GNAT family N-acetyltransferase [Texcoconibacillus texcoconensis]|uniref:Diamine N-acetyltransferase n=1 Tax=Texcoconibacillus texcoconensis TaxID=1095777 RepID=A0A840QP83_9BACI|nr:GNAT family N-acetyltransferase [Texcoconibacillus texcoconensis]MBB5173151.1 diamine N-acetyltransferase [Texcoconibacillus texcoconensis]
MEDKLQFRPLEKDDLEFIYKMRINPNVMDYWFEEPYTTREKLKKSFEEEQDNNSHREFILYNLKETVGYTCLYDIDHRHRNAEFAIMIDPSQQGKGYATEATRLIVEYGFNQLNLKKLYLYVIKNNEKAFHIYRKLGFQTEGELKKHFFVDGKYHDALMMGLLREDYVA